MDNRTIALVWAIGAALALVVYVIGPDHFLQTCFAALTDLQAAFQAVMQAITVKAYEVVRAAAVGLFVVFLVLGLIAAGRGLRARAALVVVTAVYLVLLYPVVEGDYVSSSRWFGAFVLAGAGALVMTRRLASMRSYQPQAATRVPERPDEPWAARRP